MNVKFAVLWYALVLIGLSCHGIINYNSSVNHKDIILLYVFFSLLYAVIETAVVEMKLNANCYVNNLYYPWNEPYIN